MISLTFAMPYLSISSDSASVISTQARGFFHDGFVQLHQCGARAYHFQSVGGAAYSAAGDDVYSHRVERLVDIVHDGRFKRCGSKNSVAVENAFFGPYVYCRAEVRAGNYHALRSAVLRGFCHIAYIGDHGTQLGENRLADAVLDLVYRLE